MYGMACSAVLPLILSISMDYRIKFNANQISYILISPVLSNMGLASLLGMLMGWNIDLLFECLMGISLLIIVDVWFLFRQMTR